MGGRGSSLVPSTHPSPILHNQTTLPLPTVAKKSEGLLFGESGSEGPRKKGLGGLQAGWGPVAVFPTQLPTSWQPILYPLRGD